MKSSTLAVIVVIIIAIVGLGWWWYAKAPSSTGTPAAGTQEQGTPQVNDTPGGTDVGAEVGVTTGGQPVSAYTVRYTSEGFSPKSITVPVGTTVTFINQTSNPMWIGSDEHPTHTDYDGTSRTTHCSASYTGPAPFDECGQGNTYEFTFTKAGSFDYHNHAAAQNTGTVIVE